MKYMLSGILFLLISSSVPAQPNIDSVITAFFKKYENIEPPYILKFQKRKEGWFTSQIDYQHPNDYKNIQLFWSGASQSFVKLNYIPRQHTEAFRINQDIDQYKSYYLETYEKEQFALHSYYGYPGWDWDVIREYGNQTNLTDALLESLARAYSAYASGFLMDQYGYHFANNDADRDILPDSIPINSRRKDKFINYEVKAIQTFERLLQQNPGYITKVGSIAIKVANEHMYAWSTLRIAGYKKDASTFLENIRYPDSLLSKARLYFEPMKLNSIFISGGDNDTYPLWYLQYKEGFRADVTVLNFSLLGMRRMIHYLYNEYKQELFSTKPSEYMRSDFDYAMYVKGDCANIPTLAQLPDIVRKEDGRRVYPCKKIMKVLQQERTGKDSDGVSTSPAMVIELGNYLFMSDYMLLDIIEKNYFKHPIYLAYPDMYKGLSPYLNPEGIVYRLREQE